METKWNRQRLDKNITTGRLFWIIPAEFDISLKLEKVEELVEE